MRTKRTIKMLTVALMLMSILAATTMQVRANPGAGIDFFDPDPTIYTVIFYSNDNRVNTTLAQIQVAEGNSIGTAGMPQIPTRNGFTFIGWNTMPNGTGTTFTANTVINSNLSVYAQWRADVVQTPTPTPTPEPDRVTVTFHRNDGTGVLHATRTLNTGSALGSNMPANPTRPGFIFNGWLDRYGNTFLSSTNVHAGMDVFAQWTPVIVTPPIVTPPPVIQPPVVIVTPTPLPPTPAPPTPELQTPEPPEPPEEPTPEPPPLEEIDISTQDVPQAPYDMEEADPPLASPFLIFSPMGVRSWALLNLIMTVAGVLLLIVTIIRLLKRKRKEEKEDDKRLNSPEYFSEYNPEKNPENKEERKFRLIWFVVEGIAALIAIIVFLITQDLTARMALMDWWTILHVILLAVVIIASIVIYRRKKKKDEEEEQAQQRPLQAQ